MKTQVLTLTVEMPNEMCAMDLLLGMIQAYRDTVPTPGIKFTHLDWQPLIEGLLDLSLMGESELEEIAQDLNHPQRAEAGEILDSWRADDISRRTECGGEA